MRTQALLAELMGARGIIFTSGMTQVDVPGNVSTHLCGAPLENSGHFPVAITTDTLCMAQIFC